MGRIFEVLGIIDAKINEAIAPLVRFWTEWTGMSNFALSKVLLALVVCVAAMRGILLAISTSPLEEGISFLTLLFWPGWRFIHLKRVENATNQESNSTTPSVEVYLLREAGRSTRLVLILLILLWWMLQDSIALQQILSLTNWLFMILELYVTYYYTTPKGGSKIKKLLKQLAALPHSIKFPRPVPFPT